MFEELMFDEEKASDELLLGPFSTKKKIRSPSSTSMSSKGIVFTISFVAVCFMAIFSLANVSSNFQERTALEEGNEEAVATYTIKIEFTPGIVFGIAIAIGVILCLYGYRIMKPAFFMIGFGAGATIFYDFIHPVFKHEEWGEVATILIVLAAGILLGLAIVTFVSISVFIVGGIAGVLFAEFLHVAFLHHIYLRNPVVVLYFAMAFFAILFGYFALHNEKPILILFTSWIGSYLVVRGIGYFVGGYPSPTDLRSVFYRLNPGRSVYIPDEYWAYFVATLFLTVLSMLIQFYITAADFEHEIVMITKKEDEGRCDGENVQVNYTSTATRLV